MRVLLPGALLLSYTSRAAEVDYERDIKAIFKARCISCHGSVKQKGGLRLDAGALIVKGGKHPVIVPGDSRNSPLVERLLSIDAEERMPPEGARLTSAQIELVRQWIDSGATFPAGEPIPMSPAEHWAFQPLHPCAPPTTKNSAWIQNGIDSFILAELEQRGLQAPPPAQPRALLRRAYLDVTGLPPSLADQERVAPFGETVDRLLAKPEYGERWARHWLDVVRYADSNGYERDAEKPFVWRYRDYVIQSLNQDKPFDRFVLEQLAGDELPDRSLESQIATGFLRLGHWDDEPADPVTDRYNQLDDIVSTTGQAFLGLTIGCARCHDHKFEPLSTRDYYGLVAVFNPLERPRNGRTELTTPFEKTEIYRWHEPSAPAAVTHVLMRGSPTSPGDPVGPAVPVILVKQQPAFIPGEMTSQRRLGLAQWIAHPDNPLTARVIVNRAWQQHFGGGLVTTSNDFGLMGAAPCHPALLDWLAHWFIHEAHWSLKQLHRLILTSAAWQSVNSPGSSIRYRRLEVEAIRDSILSVSGRLNPKRFGPAMKLAIPKAALEANTDKESSWQPSDEAEVSRRSIYTFIKRGLVVPMLETLDFADTVSSCPQRQVTTVAPQALSLFNGEFVNQQAGHFAARLKREAGHDPAEQITLAWRLALCRRPSANELSQMQTFLQTESLGQLCRVILNLNEFVYPE